MFFRKDGYVFPKSSACFWKNMQKILKTFTVFWEKHFHGLLQRSGKYNNLRFIPLCSEVVRILYQANAVSECRLCFFFPENKYGRILF